jgi:hypothetical protein
MPVCHFFCDFVFGVCENDLILQSKIIKYGIKQFVYEEIYFDADCCFELQYGCNGG